MQNLLDELKNLLATQPRFTQEGRMIKQAVIDAAQSLDAELLRLLMSHDALNRHFFQEVDGVMVFDKVKLLRFVSNKAFLEDSYTAFKNKIGLATKNADGTYDAYLSDSKEVVLAYPYKDCMLEGGQTKEDQKRNEIFWNETLAPDDIDRLTTPKAFSKVRRYTAEGVQENVTDLSLQDNYIIKGNNLLALYSLLPVYRGKVKLIYIDPPYNTDKDSFGYNDSFKHSTWLTFMKDRLKIARDFLTEDGVLFISIDDKEHAYLKVLCDELYERKNFIGDIILQTATDNNPSQVSTEHEYILIYAKNKEAQMVWAGKNEEAGLLQEVYLKFKKQWHQNSIKIQEELRLWIKQNKDKVSSVTHYDNVDSKGVFHDGDVANTKFGGYTYDVIHPKTGKVCKTPEKGYRFKYETMQSMIANDDVMFGEDETTLIKPKKRLENAKDYLRSVIYEDGRSSTKEIEKMFYKDFFKNPKSPKVLKRLFRFVTDKNSIILDFFAGSGTTAQAVIELNQEDEGMRKFVLCEQLDYAENKTARRVEKVIQKYGIGSFTYLELANANQHFVDKIQAAATEAELLELWQTMQAEAFMSYKVTPDMLDKNAADFEALSMDDKKRFLIEALDKNMLYVPYCDMESREFGMSEADKAATRAFYHLNHQAQ